MVGSNVQSGQQRKDNGRAIPLQPVPHAHDAMTLPVAQSDTQGHASAPVPTSPDLRPSALTHFLAVHATLIAIGLLLLALCTGLALGTGVALGQSLSHRADSTRSSSPVTNGNDQVLPASWRASGRTAVEAGEAMAVAATFVQRYEGSCPLLGIDELNFGELDRPW